MKTKLPILETNLKVYGPLVRYSDACAAIEKLETRCAELEKQLERMALAMANEGKQMVQTIDFSKTTAGRWDGPAKVL